MMRGHESNNIYNNISEKYHTKMLSQVPLGNNYNNEIDSVEFAQSIAGSLTHMDDNNENDNDY